MSSGGLLKASWGVYIDFQEAGKVVYRITCGFIIAATYYSKTALGNL
jgi:hypothetical protein